MLETKLERYGQKLKAEREKTILSRLIKNGYIIKEVPGITNLPEDGIRVLLELS